MLAGEHDGGMASILTQNIAVSQIEGMAAEWREARAEAQQRPLGLGPHGYARARQRSCRPLERSAKIEQAARMLPHGGWIVLVWLANEGGKGLKVAELAASYLSVERACLACHQRNELFGACLKDVERACQPALLGLPRTMVKQ
jgi:hypothetical protein